MSYVKIAGLFLSAAFALGLGSGAKATPLSYARLAVEASGVADRLVIEAQTLGMERRHERSMGRHERRMDRRANRHERRMDRRH